MGHRNSKTVFYFRQAKKRVEENLFYFLILLINQKTSATTTMIIMIVNTIPALKTPPIKSQLDSDMAMRIAIVDNVIPLFMILIFLFMIDIP